MRKRMALPVPALVIGAALAAAFVTVSACKRGPSGPPWVQAAPAGSQMGLSGRLGWLMRDPNFRKLLDQSPAVSQSLDVFLQRAHVNPATDPGRLTVHLLDTPDEQAPTKGVLLALDQFQDPKALQNALASNFPPEGTLRWNGQDCPLHVILDVEAGQFKAHLRALGDPEGRIWIGDLATLTKAANGTFGPPPLLARAAAWITPGAPLQGFLKPDDILRSLREKAHEDLSLELPQGIAYLVWSVTPPGAEGQPYEMELAVSGEEAGIAQTAPWMQRLAAIAGSVQKGQTPPPEIQSGKDWASLRLRLTGAQVQEVLSKLGQSFVSLPQAASPKA